jgi:hypothetical protein
MVDISSSTVPSKFITATASAINSVACGPKMCTPRISPYVAGDDLHKAGVVGGHLDQCDF